jgi:hypothetical protein
MNQSNLKIPKPGEKGYNPNFAFKYSKKDLPRIAEPGKPEAYRRTLKT